MDLLRLLIVDDERDALEALELGLSDPGWSIATAGSRQAALRHLKSEAVDIVVTDLRLGDGSGLDVLTHIREHQLETRVVVITAHGTVDTAVQAIRGGAHDYLQKPFRMADLKRLIQRLEETIRLRRENERLREQLAGGGEGLHLVGNSPAFVRVMEFVRQVAPSPSTVLITGESGTGKELAAAALHHFSPRREKAYVRINCGAIPENLVESELFGYEKGAFTGAVKAKKGKFEVAHGGTLFLDEIGDLPRSTQVKLLRVLQNGELERVGGTEPLRVNVRVVAATNADLEARVAEGSFREDLFYRLNVITIVMPPLRERREDVPLLVQHFVQKYGRINQKGVQGVTAAVLAAMHRYPWRGNIRELENMIERAVVLARDERLDLELFPALGGAGEGADAEIGAMAGMTMADIEKQAIIATLAHCGYDKNRTAATLGIGLATLYRKIKEYGIADR